jgi:hypothetical protein
MVPHGDVLKANGSLSFHSDMPMAPAKPLQLVWAAVNRNTAEGPVMGPEHRVPLDKALRAITIEAAYSIQQEKRVGSIEVGKDANLTLLDQSPYDVPPAKLKDIRVWGTMLEGRLQPVGGKQPRSAATQVKAAAVTSGPALREADAGTSIDATTADPRAELRRRTLLAVSRRDAELGLCTSDAEWRSEISAVLAAQLEPKALR